MEYKEFMKIIAMLKLGGDLNSYAESKLTKFAQEQEVNKPIKKRDNNVIDTLGFLGYLKNLNKTTVEIDIVINSLNGE